MNNSQRNLKQVDPVTLSIKHLCQETEDTVLKITVLMRLATIMQIQIKSFHEKQIRTSNLSTLLELTNFRREREYRKCFAYKIN